LKAPRPAQARLLPKTVILAFMVLLSACQAGMAVPFVPPTLAASRTPFQPATATATPKAISVWVSPSVPPALRTAFEEDIAAAGISADWVGLPEAALVQLRPSASNVYAVWTYALAAAFPTIEDSIDWATFSSRWKVANASEPPILASPDVRWLLEERLGPPGAGAVQEAVTGDLVSQAWATRSQIAIVPFEALQPMWKVLAIDGQSPVRKDFVGDGYPLQVTFGLEGDAAAVQSLSSAFGLSAGPRQVNRDPSRMTVVVLTGVTALTRATAWRMQARGIDYPDALIGDWLRQADITHVSNEVAFTPDCPPPTEDLTILVFCSQPGYIGLLEDIGTDVVELTGNHVLDAGTAAFQYSMDLYDERGWKTFGGGRDLASASQPALFEHNGNRLAFLGCNEAGPTSAWATASHPGALPCGEDRLRSEIQELRRQGYLPIFTFQWHEHYIPWPAASQREAFEAAADAGAVIVSGSQAHQPQGFEFRGDTFIHYGPGNLFFDQMWALAVRQEFIDRYVFYDGRLVSVELLTAMLEDWAQPRPMTSDERADFLQTMFKASGW